MIMHGQLRQYMTVPELPQLTTGHMRADLTEPACQVPLTLDTSHATNTQSPGAYLRAYSSLFAIPSGHTHGSALSHTPPSVLQTATSVALAAAAAAAAFSASAFCFLSLHLLGWKIW